MDFILGLPYVPRIFLNVFVAMLKDAEKIIDRVDVALASRGHFVLAFGVPRVLDLCIPYDSVPFSSSSFGTN